MRHACRSLLHRPGFTLVAALTLALGVGVNSTFFTAYNALALKPLPVADPDHVVRLERWFEHGMIGDVQYDFSYPEYLYCRDHNDVFAGLVAASWPIRVLAQRGEAPADLETLQGELVSANYFDDLGISARTGRTFFADDERLARPVIVLSDLFWRRRFNGDPRILGSAVVMNGVAVTIIGVASEEFTGTSVGLQVPDFWAPLWMQKQLAPAHDWSSEPNLMQLQLLARLEPSVPFRQAQAEADAIIRRFGAMHDASERTKAVTLQHTSFLGNTEDPRFQAVVAGLMLLVGMVLLAACANIANMLFARGAMRRQEISVRLALGASRGRVIRHLLTESIVLSLLGGAMGLLFSIWGSKLLRMAADQMLAGPLTGGLAVKLNVSPDVRVLAYTLAISVLAGIAFGLPPALRSSGADLTTAIKDDGAFFGARLTRSRLRSGLVAAQVTVSMMLLIIAGLLLRGMMRAQEVGAGFDTQHVFMLNAAFGDTPAKAAAMQTRIMERLETLPAIRSVGLGSGPLLGTWTPPIVVEGPEATLRGRTLASYASDTYFDTLGIALVRGRLFTRQEAQKGAAVAVVSESTARRFWPDQDPIGKRFQLDMNFRGKLKEFEVAGIVKDVRFANLTRLDPAHVYLLTSSADSYTMLVRIQGDAKSATNSVRGIVQGIDPTLLPGLSFISLEDGPLRLRRSLAQALAMVAALLAMLAVALAAVGIYGIMAFLVTQRIREIGIRVALGANSGRVLNAVIVQGLRPVTIGIGLGVAAGAGLSSLLHSGLSFPGASDLLYGIPFYDPASFVGLSALLLSIAAAASALPARRALRVDPAAALRSQ